jgi:2'-5' RNA ligase
LRASGKDKVLIQKEKYFIALVPPDPLQEKLMDLKRLVKSEFQSSHALRSPAHITLAMPFQYLPEKEENLFRTLEKYLVGFDSFPVSLKGFGFFPPRVVFVAVEENPALKKLQEAVVSCCREKLGLFHSNYRDRPFHPHITIGFRDLKPQAFEAAGKYFENRDFREVFTCGSVAVLKLFSAGWKEIKSIPLR